MIRSSRADVWMKCSFNFFWAVHIQTMHCINAYGYFYKWSHFWCYRWVSRADHCYSASHCCSVKSQPFISEELISPPLWGLQLHKATPATMKLKAFHSSPCCVPKTNMHTNLQLILIPCYLRQQQKERRKHTVKKWTVSGLHCIRCFGRRWCVDLSGEP